MFSEQLIDKLWKTAICVDGKDPNIWRKDIAGAWIRRDQYGRHTTYGWVIDHIRPLSQNGTNDLDNLQSLHWRNNEFKGDDYPNCKTCLSSEGNKNIEKIRLWKIKE